jgi:hypothetical protein
LPDRDVLFLRVVEPELTANVRDYAARHNMSVNQAAQLLIASAMGQIEIELRLAEHYAGRPR